MRSEYDFSEGVRGKYAARFRSMRLKVMLDPDVASVFPDSLAVNEALRAMVRLDAGKGRRPARRKRAG